MKFDLRLLLIFAPFFSAFSKNLFGPSHLIMTLGPQQENIIFLACPTLPDYPSTRFYDYPLASSLKNSDPSGCHTLLGDPLFQTRIILEPEDFNGGSLRATGLSLASVTLGTTGFLNVGRLLYKAISKEPSSYFDNSLLFLIFGVLGFIVTGQAIMASNSLNQFSLSEDKKIFTNMIVTIENMVDKYFLAHPKLLKSYKDLISEKNFIGARALYNKYYARSFNNIVSPQKLSPKFLEHIQDFPLDQSPTYKSIPTGRGIL